MIVHVPTSFTVKNTYDALYTQSEKHNLFESDKSYDVDYCVNRASVGTPTFL